EYGAFINTTVFGGLIVRWLYLVHDHATDLVQLDVFRVLRRNRSDRHADHGTLHVARRDQLCHHGAGEIDRDGKPVAGIESGLTGDRRIDADELAPHVD